MEKSVTTPEILQKAKEIFWDASESWTGHRWNWDEAGDETHQRFIKRAIEGTRPPLPEEI